MKRNQKFGNRIKLLTELLWEYTGVTERGETENKEKLRSQFFALFDDLEGPEENLHHIKDIRSKIICDMERDYFDDIEVAEYTRDLVVYGFG